MKDTPVDRVGPRERLVESLDAVFKEPIDRGHNLDAVEGKLFGIGVESYTVGSHEFYFGYALSRRMLYTLDTGHYHPTETITDKISAVLMFVPGDPAARQPRRPLGQRPRRASSTTISTAIAQELVRGDFLAAHAHRPRLLRRQHQPRRRVGDRHAQHAQVAAQGAARADRRRCASWKRPATTPAGWPCRRSSRRCRSARSGTTTARPKTSPSGARGWPRSSSTSRRCWSPRPVNTREPGTRPTYLRRRGSRSVLAARSSDHARNVRAAAPSSISSPSASCARRVDRAAPDERAVAAPRSSIVAPLRRHDDARVAPRDPGRVQPHRRTADRGRRRSRPPPAGSV